MTIRPLYQLVIIAALLYWRVDPKLIALLIAFMACAWLLYLRAPRSLDAILGLHEGDAEAERMASTSRAEVWAWA